MSVELPLVSIIIVNYNGKKFLRDCMGSLAGLDYPEDRREIIIVDNASSDGSCELIRAEYPEVRLMVNGQNLGFAGGNNVGIRAARGELIALLNNDTVVHKDWLIELVKPALDDPLAGIVTSKMLFRDRPTIINNAGSIVLPNGWGSDRGFNQVDQGQFDLMEEVFAACGASMLVRKSTFDDIGLFDESFFCYYEDTDLSWRARLRGWKIVYNPRSIMYHVHSGTSIEWSEFFTFHVLRNRQFVLLKNAWFGLFFRSLKDFLKHTFYDSGLIGRKRRREAAVKNYYNFGIRMRVLGSFISALPSLLGKRIGIRRRIKADESSIMIWIKTGRRPDAQA